MEIVSFWPVVTLSFKGVLISRLSQELAQLFFHYISHKDRTAPLVIFFAETKKCGVILFKESTQFSWETCPSSFITDHREGT